MWATRAKKFDKKGVMKNTGHNLIFFKILINFDHFSIPNHWWPADRFRWNVWTLTSYFFITHKKAWFLPQSVNAKEKAAVFSLTPLISIFLWMNLMSKSRRSNDEKSFIVLRLKFFFYRHYKSKLILPLIKRFGFLQKSGKVLSKMTVKKKTTLIEKLKHGFCCMKKAKVAAATDRNMAG